MGAGTREWRHALRGLMRRPLASATAVLTLALALAASAVLLLVIHALYLAPLPWSNHERLVYIGTEMSRIGVPDADLSWGQLRELGELPALAQVAASQRGRVALQHDGSPESVPVTRAEAGLFGILGTDTVHYGRGFTNEEVEAGEAVVVLAEPVARDWFGAADAALGRDLQIDGRGHRVVGVLRAGAQFPDRDSRLLLPLQRPPAGDGLDGNFGAIQGIGLLSAADGGGALNALNAQLPALVERLTATSPEFKAARDITGLRMYAHDWRTQRVGDVGGTLTLLAAALAGLLALAACNVSNVLMERVAARRGELSVRMALGASRLRLLRLVLADALLLSLLGWLLGIVLAIVLIAGLSHWLWLDRVVAIGVEVATVPIALSLLLTVALSVLTALLPALTVARLDTGTAGLSQRGGSDGRAQRARRWLVGGQTAISLSLLVIALLLVRSLISLWQVDPGFARDGVITAEIELAGERYAEAEARQALARGLLDRAGELGGVDSVGISDALPFGSSGSMSAYEIETLTDPEQPPIAYRGRVSSGYFQAMGIGLLRGRGFSEHEQYDDSRPVAVIDQVMADRYFEGRDPIGHRIRFTEEGWREIVGVVGSVRQRDLAEAGQAGQIYLPLSAAAPTNLQLVLRSRLPSANLVPLLRDTVAGLDAGLPLRRVLSMEQRLDDSLSDRIGPMRVVLFFAVLALLLAGLGLYGLLATTVIERRGEIGVRMALGADRRRIVGAILRDGLRLVAVGLVAGLVVVALVVPLLRHHLYGIGVADPVSFALATGLLLAIAVLAAAVPAWRAGRVAPATALRNE